MIKTEDHEERTANIGGKDGQEASIRNISDQALEIVSQGAMANPESENTMAVAVVNGETTVYRIFRQRHMSGGPACGSEPVDPACEEALRQHDRGTEGHSGLDRSGRRQRPRRHQRPGDSRQGRGRGGPTDDSRPIDARLRDPSRLEGSPIFPRLSHPGDPPF